MWRKIHLFISFNNSEMAKEAVILTFLQFIRDISEEGSNGDVLKNGVLKNLAKITGKHLCLSLLFNKVAGLRFWRTLY